MLNRFRFVADHASFEQLREALVLDIICLLSFAIIAGLLAQHKHPTWALVATIAVLFEGVATGAGIFLLRRRTVRRAGFASR